MSSSSSHGDNTAASSSSTSTPGEDNAVVSSVSWECLPSTSWDCMPSTSWDCMPSTSRDCLPSTSRQEHLPSTSRQQHLPSTSRQEHLPSTSRQQHLPSTSRQQHLPSTSRQQHSPSMSLQQHLPSTSRQQHLPSTSRQQHLPSTSRSNVMLVPWDNHAALPTPPKSISLSSPSSLVQNDMMFMLHQALNGNTSMDVDFRVVTLKLDNVCRICMSEDENEMFINALEDETLLKNIEIYYKIKIQSYDTCSKMICQRCVDYINEWQNRIKAAYEAQLIQNYLGRKAIEKAAKSKKNNSIRVTPDNEQVVQSLSNTGDEMYLQSNTEMVVGHNPEELQASSSVVPTNLQLSYTTRLSKVQSKKDTCIFCTGNNKHLKADFRKKLCDKHSKPYTCPVENCVYVFPNLDLFLMHYRYHKNIKKTQTLCRICFKVLNSTLKGKTEHRHKSYKNMLICCSMSFLSMLDLVLHKLKKHKAKIIMTLRDIRKSIQMPGNLLPEPVSKTEELLYENTDQLFTCIEPNCDKVFNSLSNNCDHYREHNDVSEEYYLCGICLNIFNSKNDLESLCSHVNPMIFCYSCNIGFSSLHDLAKHKLCIHNSVVLCGEENIPGCPVCSTVFESNAGFANHYIACYSMESKIGILDINAFNSASETVGMTEYTECDTNGSYICKYCTVPCHSCLEYIEHSLKKHGHAITIKDGEIKLCPVCDRNYNNLDFVSHVEVCTLSMKIKSNNPSIELFGCPYCRTVFTVFSSSQFRAHVLFCKSFQEHIYNGKKYFQCVNCTFKSSYHPKCVAHANLYCIYFKLKINYAMGADEKLKVEYRNKLLKEDCDDNLLSINTPPVVITIDHPANVLSDNNEIHWNKNASYYCNSTKFKILNLYNFSCKYCGNTFFDEYVFIHHLDKDGKPCRMKLSWYCTRCLLDFENENNYKAHLSVNYHLEPELIIPYTVKKELLAEESTSELSDGYVMNESNTP